MKYSLTSLFLILFATGCSSREKNQQKTPMMELMKQLNTQVYNKIEHMDKE